MKRIKSEFQNSKHFVNNIMRKNVFIKNMINNFTPIKKNFSFLDFFKTKIFKKNNSVQEMRQEEEIDQEVQNEKQFLKNKDQIKQKQINFIDGSNSENDDAHNEEKNDIVLKKENSMYKTQDKEIEELKTKYEIYQKYEKNSIVEKDEEFGDVIRYEDYVERGIDKFDSNLTKYYNINKSLENNKSYKNLSKLIDEKSRSLSSNFKEEYKYKLASYEERWYKEAIHSRANNDLEYIKLADNMKKKSNPIRNRIEFSEILESSSKNPIHPSFATKIETPFESFVDPFQYLFNNDSKDTKKFISKEKAFKEKMSFRYNHIYNEIKEEFSEKIDISPSCSFQMNEEYIIFKKKGDDYSLYAVDANAVEPEKRGTAISECDENTELKCLFSIDDLVDLNKAFTDPEFLDFSQRLIEKIEMEESSLEYFEMCPKNQYLLLFFDVSNQEETPFDSSNTKNNEFNFIDKESKMYDIIIKDIKNNILIPVVFHNCDIKVAFDKFDGLFYTQKELTNRFSKVFRHQIGVSQHKDKLIYHERNQNFRVSTYNCNSKEYVYLEISTNSSPKVNEIWIKPTNDLNSVDFFCFKKIEKNINYKIQFSDNFFYMLTNKTDSYDKILKKIVWNKNNTITGLLENSIVKNENEKDKKDSNTSLIEKVEEEKIFSLECRTDISNEKEKNLIQDVFTDLQIFQANSKSLVNYVTDIIKIEDNINIIDFQAFKNYTAILEEIDKKRQIRIINSKTNNYYIHEPTEENSYVYFDENSTFKSNYLRYGFTNPIISNTLVDYSMGTRKSYQVHVNKYTKINPENYESNILYVPDRDNEVKIPVLLYFNKHLYDEKCPIILYTKGSQSRKEDLTFDSNLFSMLDRGFIYAIPQIRGTKFFDFDWYSQGISENKLKHFTDFIDVTIFLKEKNISEKLILYGDGYSGGITTSITFLQNPDEYKMLVANNSAFDLMDLCMFGSDDVDLIEEFGNINNPMFYELIKMYSPYHSTFPLSHSPILVCADEESEYMPHSRKFVAKLRKNNQKNKFENRIIFENNEDQLDEDQKKAFIYSNIVGNIYQY